MDDRKTCTKCGETKPLDEYPPDLRKRDGRQAQCRACKRIAGADWRARNPDHAKTWRAKHPDRVKELFARWCAENAEHKRESDAEWRARNVDHRNAVELARRTMYPGLQKAKERNASVIEVFTIDELRAHLLSRGVDPDVCVHCGREPRTDWDHLRPLGRSGPHALDNLVPSCHSCNCRKHDKLPDPALVARLARYAEV